VSGRSQAAIDRRLLPGVVFKKVRLLLRAMKENIMWYGIEIECFVRGHNPSSLCDLLNDWGKKHEPKYWFQYAHSPTGYITWGVGYDLSMRTPKTDLRMRGCEVRSPILPSIDIDTIVPVVRFLKSIGKTNHKCGLHIHVSVEVGAVIDYAKLWKLAKKELGNVTKKSRRLFAEWDDPQNYFGHSHCAISRRNVDRVEFRMFNGSLNTRHVCRCIRQSLYLVERCTMRTPTKSDYKEALPSTI
jgi:hypothetical protein